jgi:hypothetical protein
MNWSLAKIRLSGVGPVDARFDPLEIDLTDPDGRRTLDTVLWLVNGGGKTVLIRLLFAVLRPDKVNQIGIEDQRPDGRVGRHRINHLGAYVLPSDTAHVILEWRLTQGDEIAAPVRLVTGLVAAWRAGRATGELGNLRRLWYTIRSDDGAIGADDLVTTVDGHRVPFAAFRESIERLGRTGLGRGRRPLVRPSETQDDWLGRLDDLGLDPAIFGYELTMNRGESSANNLLTFASDREFIGFLIKSIIDPDSIAGVDSSLAAVASKIAKVPETERELTFVSGVSARLEPITAAIAEISASRAAREAAERVAQALRAALTAAEQQAATRLEAAGIREAAERSRADELGRRKGVLDAEVREYRLAAAMLTAAESNERVRITREESQRRADDVTAWSLVPRLVRQRELDAEIAELVAQVAAQTQAQAPLRERRDVAAGRLRSRLSAEVVIQREVIREAGDEANQRTTTAAGLDLQARDARGEAVSAKTRREMLEREIEAAANRRDAAVRNGTIERGERAKAALDRTRADIQRGELRLARIEERRMAIADERDRRITREAEVTIDLASLRSRRDRDVERVALATAERERIAEHALIRALSESETPDLDFVGAALVERLSDRAVAAAGRRLDLAVRSADDRRALDALERTKALPASLDVEVALGVLSASGIPAVSGWAYLTEAVRRGQHEAVIAAAPDLVAGVVVTRPGDLPAARTALDEAGLETASVVSVATGVPIVAAGSAEPATDRFVVLPPAALHDPGAAVVELERRSERVHGWDDRAQAEEVTERSARTLARELSVHLETWPPGALREETARISEQSQTIAAMERELTASVMARAELRREDEELGGEAGRVGQQLRRIAPRVPELERLVTDEDAAAARTLRIADLTAEEVDWLELERTRYQEAQHERELADEARSRASEARNAIVRVMDEIGRVTLANTPPQLDLPTAQTTAAEPLDGLRARFRSLEDELTAKTVGSPAAQRLAERERECAGVRSVLETANRAIVARAEVLLASDEGVDAERQRRAMDVAERASHAALADRIRAEHQSEAAVEAVKEANRAIEAAHYGRRPEIVQPADRLAAELAIAARISQRERIDEEERAAVAARDEAEQTVSTEKARIDNLAGQRSVIEGRLGTELLPPGPTDPFVGDREAIVEAVRSAGRALDDADQARRRADELWRTSADALASFLHEGRNNTLAASPLGRRVAVLATMPADVAGVAEEVRLRGERLRVELTELKTHRELLVHELAEATDRALREIAQAERRSKLPDGLHEWSRQPFLQINFERPGSHEDLRARLTAFVADIVNRPPERRPSGAELLLQASEAAIVGEFKVSVLKPNDSYALRYVPIQETAVMSNGQRATAAMCLLMILSELRAKNRTKGVPGVGVLFLDNPFGNASAGYLVSVQRRVAAALGIQPVYTTGVRDYDALASFRNIIPLSNDQARGRMLRYVRANPALLKALAPRDTTIGHVSSARVLARIEE